MVCAWVVCLSRESRKRSIFCRPDFTHTFGDACMAYAARFGGIRGGESAGDCGADRIGARARGAHLGSFCAHRTGLLRERVRPARVAGNCVGGGEPQGLEHPSPPRVRRAWGGGEYPDDDLLSRGNSPHYHRRCGVSRSCSGWEGVGPPRYGRQEFG